METAGGEKILSENEIDKRIKMFREKIDKEIGTLNLKKIIAKKLRNPTNEDPMRIAEFLSFLEVTPFKKNLKKCILGLRESEKQYMQEQNYLCT